MLAVNLNCDCRTTDSSSGHLILTQICRFLGTKSLKVLASKICGITTRGGSFQKYNPFT